MNKKFCLIAILTIKLIFSIFAKEPDEKELFNYYCACAIGDLNAAQFFLQKHPKSVESEMSASTYQLFASYLLDNGIVEKFESEDEKAKWIESYKRYPINIAAMYGHLNIVKLLISYKSNLEIKEETGYTALMRACQKGHRDIAELLLQNRSDVNAISNDGETPLMFASAYGHTEIVDLLLNNNADANAKNNSGVTALMFACEDGHTEIVDLLLNNNADANAKTNSGMTALICASGYGHTEIVDLLLKNNADTNAKDCEGNFALIFASQGGYTEIVDLLIRDKTDVNSKNNTDTTSLMLASQNGHAQIVDLLLKNNADVNITTNKGFTALDMASNSEIQRMLLNAMTTQAEEWTFSRFKMLANKNIGKVIYIKNATVISINSADNISIYDNRKIIIEASVNQHDSHLVEKILSLYEALQSNSDTSRYATFYGVIKMNKFDMPILHIVRIEE